MTSWEDEPHSNGAAIIVACARASRASWHARTALVAVSWPALLQQLACCFQQLQWAETSRVGAESTLGS